MMLPFKAFLDLELRIGKIIEAGKITGSRNLIKLTVDFGSEKRESVAGLLKFFRPEELLNKDYVFVLNLERKKIMGIESQCMILAAEDNKGRTVLIKPENEVDLGSRIR